MYLRLRWLNGDVTRTDVPFNMATTDAYQFAIALARGSRAIQRIELVWADTNTPEREWVNPL